VSLTDADPTNDRPTTGLDPRPIANSCLFIGSTDRRFYVLDEESLHPNPAPVPTPGEFLASPKGSCLWNLDTIDSNVYGKAAPEPAGGRVFFPSTGSSSGHLWEALRYPLKAPLPTPACVASASTPNSLAACDMTIGADPVSVPVKVEGDAFVPALPTPHQARG